jgi:predicted site-specific integrase-resolvase
MKKTELTPPALMTLREAHAALPKVSYVTIWKWARNGDLPSITIAGKRFILRRQFMKLFTDPDRRPAA